MSSVRLRANALDKTASSRASIDLVTQDVAVVGEAGGERGPLEGTRRGVGFALASAESAIQFTMRTHHHRVPPAQERRRRRL